MITSTISVYSRDASVLFDPRSTYSYVSLLFAHLLDVPRESLGTLVYMSTPVETRVDLLLLDMTDFGVILGMELLSPYHLILYYHANIATLEMPESPRLEWRGSSVSASSRVVSFLKASHMVEKGCLAYLAYVRDTTVEAPAVDSVPTVQEFSDVFPFDLPSILPNRDIDFSIDLALGT
ncbi:uncharacterized protein [Nicotiana sylvestris]|uniref:uncharacterized protein n=1 Tax=Nicotiana sylvestris TaxID=4096 RepID=UPI00388C9E78